jgi:hypothetical protein
LPFDEQARNLGLIQARNLVALQAMFPEGHKEPVFTKKARLHRIPKRLAVGLQLKKHLVQVEVSHGLRNIGYTAVKCSS